MPGRSKFSIWLAPSLNRTARLTLPVVVPAPSTLGCAWKLAANKSLFFSRVEDYPFDTTVSKG